MKKKLLKTLGVILTICNVLNMIVLSAYSAEVDNNYPSTYTYTGDYKISGGIQDGKWFYNSGNGVLDIYGSGSLGNTAAPWYGNVPWKDYSENIKEIVFHEGITDISNQAIGKGDGVGRHQNLEKVTIPSSVTYIAFGAFKDLPKLKEVVFSEGLQEIAQAAFENTGIESLTLPDSLKTLGEGSFSGCTSLKRLDLGNGVETIKHSAFYNCTGLTMMSPIPSSVKLIYLNAFALKSPGDMIETVTFASDMPELKSANNANIGLESIFNKRSNLKIYYLPGKTGFEGQKTINLCVCEAATADTSVSSFYMHSNAPYSIYEEGSSISYDIKWFSDADVEKTLSFKVTDYYDKVVYNRDFALTAMQERLTVSLPTTFKVGHYVVEATLCGQTVTSEMSVVKKLSERRDSSKQNIGLAAMATHTVGKRESIEEYARTIKLAGVTYVRDFSLLSELMNEDGTYNFNRKDTKETEIFDTYNKYGIKLLYMLSATPSWLTDSNSYFPNDLQKIYDATKAICQNYKDKIDTLQIFNEISSTYGLTYKNSPPDMYASVLKAMALGAVDSGADIKIATSGMAGGLPFTRRYCNLFLLNDVSKYFDYYAGHAYINYQANNNITQSDDYPTGEYLDAAERFGNKRTWMTEYGIRYPYTEPDYNLSLTEQKNQARSTPVELIKAISMGYDKVLWFLHGYINEYEKSYGTLNTEKEPHMVYSAISALTNQLGNAEYCGNFENMPEGVYGHKFSEGAEEIGCFWAENDTQITIKTDADSILLADIMGNEEEVATSDGNCTFTASADIKYVRVNGQILSAVNEYVKPNYDETYFKDTVSDEDRIVLKIDFDEAAKANNVATDGYELSITGANNATVTVHNFSNKVVNGSLSFSSNDDWNIEGDFDNITVPANDKLEVPITITGGDNLRRKVTSQIYINGVFNGKEISRCVTTVTTKDNYKPSDDDRSFFGFWNQDYWKYSKPNDAIITNTSAEDYLYTFRCDYTNVTGSKYIWHVRDGFSEGVFDNSEGFAYSFKTDTTPSDGSYIRANLHVQVWDSSGRRYHCTILRGIDNYAENSIYLKQGVWRQTMCYWTDLIYIDGGPDKQPLDPSKIKKIALDIEVMTDEKVIDFAITDLGALKHNNYSQKPSISNIAYNNGNIVGQVDSANISGVRLLIDGVSYEGEVNGGNVTVPINLLNGSYNVSAFVFDSYGSCSNQYDTVITAENTGTYNITYHTEDGVDVPDNASIDAGEVYTIPADIPQKSGYSFVGWATENDSDAPKYMPGETIGIFADINLYPVFKEGSPNEYAYMSGTDGSVDWKFEKATGTLTISPTDGKTDVAMSVHWGDTAKQVRTYYTADNRVIYTENEHMACPWGIYEWSADGRVSKADYSHVKKIVIEEGIKTIPEYGFHSNFAGNPNIPMTWTYHTGLTELVLPEGLVSIGINSFMNSQLTSVELPASLKTIGDRVFARDNKSYSPTITSVKIAEPSQLQSIGSQAFDQQSKLKTICLPETVNTVGNYAFRGIDNLCIVFKGNKPETMSGAITFSSSANIYYLMGRTGWNGFVPSTVGAGSLTMLETDSLTDFGKLGDNADWFYDAAEGKNKVDIYGTGTASVVWNARPWDREAVKEIVIHEGITDGNLSMFGGAYPHTALEKITIPSSMTSLPVDFCAGCSKLKTVVFAENSQLTKIGLRAFMKTAIVDINLPGSVISIGDQCFSGDPNGSPQKTMNSIVLNGDAPEVEGANGPFRGVSTKIFVKVGADGYDAENKWAQGTTEKANGKDDDIKGITLLRFSENDVYAELTSEEDGTVTAEIYNFSNKDIPYYLILAAYDDSGEKTKAVKIFSDTISASDIKVNSETLSGKMTIAETDKLKAFVWDSEALRPFCEVLSK